MQSGPVYRPFPQQAQRSPAAAATRRGIGPMISGGPHPQAQLTMAQQELQRQQQIVAREQAERRSRKPTDKNLAEGVEACIIGDGVTRYRELRDLERRLDSTMMRKRQDIEVSVNRNVKVTRTLRVWISNTVEDQPWQSETIEVDQFDFSNNMDSSYRVKIEGRLLDEEDEDISDDEDESEDDTHEDAMDEDGKAEKQPKKKIPTRTYKFSHFFKSMTVEFDKSKSKDGVDQSAEWKKPVLGPNTTTLPNSYDFDQLEFKRGGDENVNITINLVRDENPEKFLLSKPLADLLDTPYAARHEILMGIWDYVKVNKLEDEDDKRSFECDELLRTIIRREKGYIPQIGDVINHHISPRPPIKLPYTIRVDKDFHENPQPTIYDIEVEIDDPVKDALQAYQKNLTYAEDLRSIAELNDQLANIVAKVSNSKSKHAFFDALSKNPTDFIAKWLSSQKRDLEVMAGEASRGGGEDASGDEWRRGGQNSVWATDNVRESVNLMVGQRAKV